jgi:hypothetical protein
MKEASMFPRKKHIPRRTFLTGMGVSVALPFMESMLPAQARSRNTPASPATRYCFMYIPHGMIMDDFTPASEGVNFEITPILTPLKSFKDQLHIVSGLEARPAGDGSGGDHMRGAAAYLSCTPPQRNAGQNSRLATTVDQLIAQKIGSETPLPSLELGIEDTSYTGICEDGYSCSYMNTISWASPTKPLPTERNPLSVFERMFGDGSTPEQRLVRRREDRSILDSLTHDVARLTSTIGPGDKVRLEEYLDEIRDLERRLNAVSNAAAQSPVEAPAGIPQSWDEHIKLMLDLQALAFKADVTRVLTFMYAVDKIQRLYPETGVTTAFHSASHTAGTASAKKEYAKINRYHIQLLAYFLDKLRSTNDGDGSLLDHSMVILGSTMSNGDIHNHAPLPILVAGGASGALKAGRHLKYPDRTPLANLMLKVLHTADIPADSFGDSTGTVEI